MCFDDVVLPDVLLDVGFGWCTAEMQSNWEKISSGFVMPSTVFYATAKQCILELAC